MEQTDANPVPFTMLLVEDNDDHAHIVIRNLRRENSEIRIERLIDGIQAMKYLRKVPPFADVSTPDIILLDLNLPKMDGHEVLATIKKDETLRLIPTVVLTTSDAEVDKLKAYEHYVNSYLVKPLDPGALRSMLESLCYYWKSWNKVPAEVAIGDAYGE